MTNVIWWLRRDLRLHDNHALRAALESGTNVLPVFILDDHLWKGKFYCHQRAAFLLANLEILDRQLQKLGSRLVIRSGQPLEQLQTLAMDFYAEAIFAEADFTPYARQRDTQIAQNLPLKLVGGSLVVHPEKILKNDNTPYRVYTPFMRRWKAFIGEHPVTPFPAPRHIPTITNIPSDPLPFFQYSASRTGFPAGENEARNRLDKFTVDDISVVYGYAQNRNFPGQEVTSRLSPYLHLGILSPRLAVQQATQAFNQAETPSHRDSAETWLNELIWREFFGYILYHFPQATRGAFRKQYRNIPWTNDLADFEAWKSGKTGFPLVDAGMRQLAATGWMHNRLRMITASFLVKNLLINWQWGESWFMQNLLDGDIASNNGGWQWVAGTGTDAAPYFRVFNPITQSQKFDPNGTYIRRWVPELRTVLDAYIHTPWKMDTRTQEKANLRLGKDYPLPIIDLAFSRQRAIETYKQTGASIKN